MNASNEQHVEADIARLFERGLSATEHDAMSAHVRTCARCERLYEKYAAAERALTRRAPDDLASASFDRVQARLLGPAKPRPKTKWWAALGAVAAAAAVLLVLRAPTEELRARGGAEVLRPEYAIRVLRVRGDADDLTVVDATSAPLVAGDRLKVLASSGSGARWVRIRVADEAGVVHSQAATALAPDALEAQLPGVIEVPPTWKIGAVRVVATFAASVDDTDLDATEPVDREGVWIRTVRATIEAAR